MPPAIIESLVNLVTADHFRLASQERSEIKQAATKITETETIRWRESQKEGE